MTLDPDVQLHGAEHAGEISQPYWDALADGRFVLQRCGNCDHEGTADAGLLSVRLTG